MKKSFAILALFALSLPLRAQVKTGEATLNLNGTVSVGYSDDYSNTLGSDHSIAGAGEADLTGSYYNPNFLSFDIQPFYNQSRLNSSYQSMTGASGVNASAKLFGGSAFPGSISYSTAFNSSGNFNLPGLANYTTHGTTETLAVTWGVHLDNLPTLNLSFSDASNGYSIYGANTDGRLHSETFSATSSYRIAGFTLNGGYQYVGSKVLTPEFLAGEPAESTNSSGNSYFVSVVHDLPWNGNISAGASRLDLRTNLGGTSSDSYNTDIDTLTGAINFGPAPHLHFGANTYYTDNLEGSLYNTLVTAGAVVPQNQVQPASHSLSLTGFANYELPAEHLNLHGYVERQQQSFLGTSFASDSYNGTATYSNRLLGGQFNGVLGVTHTFVDTTHIGLTGLNSSANYTHTVRRWTLAGGFSYSQNTQTVLINYVTSGYSYNANVGRRLRRKAYWGAYASGARSLLSNVPGSANTSQSYSTSLSLFRLSINGSYSTASGNAVLTATGLTATPVPLPAVNPAAVVLYNGKSYSAGIGSSPIRGLTLSAIYAKALSATNGNSTLSNNNSNNMYFLATYRLRKLNFQGGYLRLVQGFSASGAPPVLTGSFYVGVSRWFNFF